MWGSRRRWTGWRRVDAKDLGRVNAACEKLVKAGLIASRTQRDWTDARPSTPSSTGSIRSLPKGVRAGGSRALRSEGWESVRAVPQDDKWDGSRNAGRSWDTALNMNGDGQPVFFMGDCRSER